MHVITSYSIHYTKLYESAAGGIEPRAFQGNPHPRSHALKLRYKAARQKIEGGRVRIVGPPFEDRNNFV